MSSWQIINTAGLSALCRDSLRLLVLMGLRKEVEAWEIRRNNRFRGKELTERRGKRYSTRFRGLLLL